MADSLDIDARLSPEGRVVIPAAVRAVLGVSAGDRVRFTVHRGEVRLVTARSLIEAVWANNQRDVTDDADESVKEVRALRDADQDRVDAKWERVADAREADTRGEEAVTADLIASLGLEP